MSPARPGGGYSGTPLPQKLGLKSGQAVLFVDLPESLAWLTGERDFAALRLSGWDEVSVLEPGYDVVHAFTGERAVLEAGLDGLSNAMRPEGMLWISWPKRSSGRQTDLGEDAIRNLALPRGLVDVKVAAVDEIWSGLKLVVRLENRSSFASGSASR